MNKMAEKNDQKMRERAERAEKFQAKLQELLALAKKKKNMLEYQEINDHFKDFALSPEQIDKILDELHTQLKEDNEQLSETIKKLLDVMEYDIPYTRSSLMDNLELNTREGFRQNY